MNDAPKEGASWSIFFWARAKLRDSGHRFQHGTKDLPGGRQIFNLPGVAL